MTLDPLTQTYISTMLKEYLEEGSSIDRLADRVTEELVEGIVEILDRRNLLVRYELSPETIRGIKSQITAIIAVEVA